MSRRLVVVVPAWGRHARLFLGAPLRSHKAALEALAAEFRGSVPVTYVFRTDDPRRFAAAIPGVEVILQPAPEGGGTPYRDMTAAHQRGIEVAGENDRVVLLTADALIGRETLATVEHAFRSGRRAVVCAGTRMPTRWWRPNPRPRDSRSLNEMAARRWHPMMRSCEFGVGRAGHPSELFFRERGAAVMRSFHAHPLAVLKDRPLKIEEGTLDIALLESYAFDEIYYNVRPDLMAMSVLDRPERTNALVPWKLDVAQILAWAVRGARPMHWWNFRHRVSIVGDASSVTADAAVADEVLRLCPYPEALAASL